MLLAVVLALPLGSHAQFAGVEGKRGDRGRELYREGAATQGIPPCANCHGRHGEGSATAGFPRLAGLPAPYIERQFEAFSDGRRHNEAMTPIARALTPQQRRAVARFLASAQAPSLPVPPPVPDRAQTLVMHGDAALGVPACSSCHGWNGAGNAPNVPYLAGQHALYLRKALVDWRQHRDSDPRRQMPQIARLLNEEDLAPLADYFAALPPPGPASGSDSKPLAAASAE